MPHHNIEPCMTQVMFFYLLKHHIIGTPKRIVFVKLAQLVVGLAAYNKTKTANIVIARMAKLVLYRCHIKLHALHGFYYVHYKTLRKHHIVIAEAYIFRIAH